MNIQKFSQGVIPNHPLTILKFINMKHWILFIFAASFTLIFSCRKTENFITDSSAKLEFSVDTLRFDTVFTELGSATRFIRVFNPHKKSIKISKISVRAGANSFFRLNIDGIPGNEATDIEIAAHDSLYIFAEVTIDPDAPLSASPFVINDQVLFETNGNEQAVTLEAWGQNANYIPNRFAAGGIASTSSCALGEITWDDPKPYVIYGILFIDSCTLNIPAGTEIYVHGGLAVFTDAEGNRINYNDGRIFVGPNGKLNITGTQERPVTIQADRLESPFADIPAQWFGLLIAEKSRGNVFKHTIIKNSIIGVFVDSLASLSLKNTKIINTAGNILTAVHADISAENCLFRSPGRSGYCVALIHGGTHKFNYCTLASYGVDQSALAMSNFQCYDQANQSCNVNPLRATFKNCIISGSRKNEIDFADGLHKEEPSVFQINFQNCAVRLEELDKAVDYQDFFTNYCDNCIELKREDVLFADVDENDFHLDSLSVVEQKAIPIPTIPFDLDGKMRDGSNTDIGCYEYFE